MQSQRDYFQCIFNSNRIKYRFKVMVSIRAFSQDAKTYIDFTVWEYNHGNTGLRLWGKMKTGNEMAQPFFRLLISSRMAIARI